VREGAPSGGSGGGSVLHDDDPLPLPDLPAAGPTPGAAAWSRSCRRSVWISASPIGRGPRVGAKGSQGDDRAVAMSDVERRGRFGARRLGAEAGGARDRGSPLGDLIVVRPNHSTISFWRCRHGLALAGQEAPGRTMSC
jgi:hypothetical protein